VLHGRRYSLDSIIGGLSWKPVMGMRNLILNVRYKQEKLLMNLLTIIFSFLLFFG
jgi:hypothetical protein